MALTGAMMISDACDDDQYIICIDVMIIVTRT